MCDKWVRRLIGGAVVFAWLAWGVAPSSVSATQTAPHRIHFQGLLLDASGNPRPDGLYVMNLGLYSAPSGGVWYGDDTCEATQRIQVVNGRFSAQIGGCTASISPEVFAQYPLYVELQLPTPATATCSTVGCADWSEPPITPRLLVASSPYAINADTLDGINSDAFAQRSAQTTFTGVATFRSAANSASAFSIENSSGSSLLVADTASMQLKVGGGNISPDATPALLVLDHKSTAGDPAGVNGAMYYNVASQKFRCHEGGAWKDCMSEGGSSMRDGFLYQTDFVRGVAIPAANGSVIDTLLASYSTTGVVVATAPSELNTPGIVRISAPDVSSGSTVGGMLVPVGEAASPVRFGHGDWSLLTRVRVTGAVSGLSVRAGFMNQINTLAEVGITAGCYVRHSDAPSVWQGVCRVGSTESVCSTGATLSEGAWHTIGVTVNQARTMATFTIDDVHQCTVGTNIPASASFLGFGVTIGRADTTPGGTVVDTDYMEVRSRRAR